MGDIGATRHTAENRLQPWVCKHFLCEDDEGFMHIVVWYGRSDAVQVRRSQASWALSRIDLDVACVLKKTGPRGDDDPATVENLIEQAPNSRYNCYPLRRVPCSLDSTWRRIEG
jgi:hypothetical protein